MKIPRFFSFIMLFFAGLTHVNAGVNSYEGEESYFKIRVSDSQTVEVTLRIPSGLDARQKVPVLLVFGGFESAGHVLDLIHTHEPVALASFDYPFSASRKLEVRDGLQILREGKELYPKTVRGIVALVNRLKKNPRIDSRRIIAIGASFGSPFVLGAAAQDRDITGVALIHGFAQIPETAEHVILRSWLPKFGWIARPFAWLISRLAWFYLGIDSPEENALRLRAEQSVLMITAQNDSFIPRAASDSLWNAIEKSRAMKTRILMEGDHLMPGADALISKLMHQVEKWLGGLH